MSVASPERASAGPEPSLDEVRALSSKHNLIPLRETFIDDCQTPVSAFLQLREDGPAYLLESAEQGKVRVRQRCQTVPAGGACGLGAQNYTHAILILPSRWRFRNIAKTVWSGPTAPGPVAF